MIFSNRIHRTIINLSVIYAPIVNLVPRAFPSKNGWGLSFDVAWSLGLIIARGQLFVSGHVV